MSRTNRLPFAGSGSIHSLVSFNAFLTLFSEVSTPRCCSSVAADLPLKLPTWAQKMQNGSRNCIYLFLRIHCRHFREPSSCGRHASSVETFYACARFPDKPWNERGLVSVHLLSGLGYKHRLVKYLSVSVRQLFPPVLLIKPGLIVSVAGEGPLCVWITPRRNEARWRWEISDRRRWKGGGDGDGVCF